MNTRYHRNPYHCPTLALTLALGTCLPAWVVADAAETGPSLPEVTVTADFRDARLQEIPVSVSVIDDTSIQQRAAKHLEAVLSSAPNVNLAAGASRGRFVQIRGVGDFEQFTEPKFQPAIGLMIDGIDMSGIGNAATLYDIDQVEVLRGPQGTSFGASALGGMINMQSANPTAEFESRLDVGVGNYNSRSLGVVVSGPLTDSLGGRLAVQQSRSDGFMENDHLDRDNTNNIDELTARGKLHWELTAESTLEMSLMYVDADNGYDAYSLDNNRHTRSDNPGFDRQETSATSIRYRQQLGTDLSLEATIAGEQSNLDYGFDEDWTFVGFHPWEFSNTDRYQRDRDSASLDVRLQSEAPLSSAGDSRWLVGVYAQERNEELDRSWFGSFNSDYSSERRAFYGQLENQLTDALRVTLGVRFERYSDDYRDSNGIDFDNDDNLWGGNLSLSYTLSESSIAYVTLAQGYKAGGVNAEASSSSPFMQPRLQDFLTARLGFDSETLINRELGLKGVYWQDRLQLRLALFDMDRQDPQLESWIWDGVNFVWLGFLETAAAGSNRGLELEARLQAGESVQLFANLGWIDTEVQDLTVFDLDLDDFREIESRDQTSAPTYQYNVGVDLQLSESLSAHLEVEGRDAFYHGYYHNAQADSYQLLHGSLSLNVKAVALTLWGRNLLDEDYAVRGLYFGNDPRDGYANRLYEQLGGPRTLGINASYHF